jgi:hypothetical protein
MLDFHVSLRGNSINAYLFIGRPVHKCGRVPIHADGMAIAPCDMKRLAATVHPRG